MEKIKVKKKNLLAYIIMTLSFMGSCSIFQGTAGTLQWAMFYYGGPLALLVLSIYCVLKNRSARITKQRRFFLGLFCLPRIIMLGYSCIVWCITRPAFPYISRGISNTLFQCVAYFCGVCIVCSEKDDILRVSMASSVTVFVLTYLLGFVQNGLVLFRALNPLDEAAYIFRKYTELHEVAYIVGILSLIHISEPTRLRRISYAVFCLKKKKTKNARLNPTLYKAKFKSVYGIKPSNSSY